MGCPQVKRPTAREKETLCAANQGSEALNTGASGDSAQELQDIEERQGPFRLAGQDFTVVLHYKRSPRDGGLGSRALVSLDIRDDAGAVQYQESFLYSVEGGTFPEICSADVNLLRGSNGTGLLIESGCLPSAPLAGGPWQLVGVAGGKLVPFGKPLVTEDEWGGFVPGAINRTANLTQVLADVLRLRVWTGYFFVSIPARTQRMGSKLHYSLKPRVQSQGVSQALKVVLQARISLHPCRESRSVLAQGRDAHPAKLPADLCKTLLARQAQTAKLHEHRSRPSVPSRG